LPTHRSRSVFETAFRGRTFGTEPATTAVAAIIQRRQRRELPSIEQKAFDDQLTTFAENAPTGAA
jgi:hypothetical protein